MNRVKLGLTAFVSGILAYGNADAQCLNHQHYPMHQFFQQTLIIQPIKPVLVYPSITQPKPYRVCPNLDKVKQTQTELTLPLRHLEPGFYITVLEKSNVYYAVGGLENMFKMIPASKGPIIPNNEQTTSWDVSTFGLIKPGTYDLNVSGNDWPLKVGRVSLDTGDKIYFHKVANLDSVTIYSRPQQPTLAPLKSN